MKLSERLKITDAAERAAEGLGPVRNADLPEDPLADIKHRAQRALFDRLGSRLYDSSVTKKQLNVFVREELTKIVEAGKAPLTEDERQDLVAAISEDIVGYGPVQPFLSDTTVTEIMVNGDDAIFIERDGLLHLTESRFSSAEHLRRVIERIVAQVGRRIDESSPMVDARLQDGSRVNAVIPPLSVDGPVLTIRKFSKEPLTIENLIELGTLNPQVTELIQACVEGRLNIIISGGTGTGKTTLLNVLSSFIPEDQRIVTIEDAVELQLNQRHVVRLESRPPNLEDKGEVKIRDLVRNSLRMRPDRIVVGEVRGEEALDMLQAMNTGHEGSLSTVHANSPRDAISRIETMVLMAGMDLPVRAIREQASSAIHVIIHLTRLKDGSRRVTEITEVVGMEGDVVTLQNIYEFDFGADSDEEGEAGGQLRPTGLRPQFTELLKTHGIELPTGIFGSPELVLAKGKGGK